MSPIKRKPIKRVKEIQPLSRDHHHTLLLCWKIRTGFKHGVDPQTIKKYVDWFYPYHVAPHFALEEKYVFPILGETHEGVKRALSEHRRLRRLFEDREQIKKSLSLLEEELDRHIRFEERELFNEIQQKADPDTLKKLQGLLVEAPFEENVEDEFWKES